MNNLRRHVVIAVPSSIYNNWDGEGLWEKIKTAHRIKEHDSMVVRGHVHYDDAVYVTCDMVIELPEYPFKVISEGRNYV